MDNTTKEDILLRIGALKDLGADCGGGGGRKWILLNDYNIKVTRQHPNAKQLVEILGVRDASMVAIFGTRWRGSFRNKKKGLGNGFTYREFLDAHFVTVGEDIGSDAPNNGNIIKKGSDIAIAIREHIDNAVMQAASEDESMGENIGEDTVEEVTMEEDTMENDGVDQTQDVQLNTIALYSRLQAIRFEYIPFAIKLIFERNGINGVYNILREGILFSVTLRGSLAWTVESAVSFLHETFQSKDDIPEEMEGLIHHCLQILQDSGNSNKILLKYRDSKKRERSASVQVLKRQRTCKSSASDKSKGDYISRVTNSVADTMKQALGSNWSPANLSAVFNKLGNMYNMVVLDADKVCYNYAELVTATLHCKFSIRGATEFLMGLVGLRPELSGVIFPVNIRKGMSRIINNGNLPFRTIEVELIVSKKKNISGLRSFCAF